MDASYCVALKPKWGKGHGRMGEVFLALGPCPSILFLSFFISIPLKPEDECFERL